MDTYSSYDPSYYDSTTNASSDLLDGLFGGTFLFIVILFVAFIVLYVVSMWRIFTKAGKPGWAALVPFYNFFVLIEIIGKPWWWVFGYGMGMIPVLGVFLTFIFNIIIMLELGRRFGKSNGFSVVALVLFPFVGLPMLAFGSSEYDPNAAPVVNFLSNDTAASNVNQNVYTGQYAQPNVQQSPIQPTQQSVQEPVQQVPVQPQTVVVDQSQAGVIEPVQQPMQTEVPQPPVAQEATPQEPVSSESQSEQSPEV